MVVRGPPKERARRFPKDIDWGGTMSRKRRTGKRAKLKAERRIDPGVQDLHHILYQRRMWKGGAIGELREHWYCRVYIPRDTLHKSIHNGLWAIPVPKEVNTRAAIMQLEMLSRHGAICATDPLEKRLKVLLALFECADEPTFAALQKQLDIVAKFYGQPS